MNIKCSGFVAGAIAVAGLLASAALAEKGEIGPTVIEFTQTGCQFLESEGGVDHGYMPMTAKDCKTINAQTGDERLNKSEVLTLKPGEYLYSCPLNPTPNYRIKVEG